MTETEWLACTDPKPMLEFLTDRASHRKLRLFGVACCRRFWHLLDEEHCRKLVEVGVPLGCQNLLDLPLDSCRKAVELAERAADEPVPSEELRTLSEVASAFQDPAEYYCACYDECRGPFDGELVASGTAAFAAHYASLPYLAPAGVVWECGLAAGYLQTKVFGAADESGIAAERSCHCDILRDIFGNPFRPVKAVPSLLPLNVVEFTRTIYDERAFTRMPELADALEEAGCHHAGILGHCCSPGSHVRGCWVVDLILKKA